MITGARLELLSAIREHKPVSIQELAGVIESTHSRRRRLCKKRKDREIAILSVDPPCGDRNNDRCRYYISQTPFGLANTRSGVPFTMIGAPQTCGKASCLGSGYASWSILTAISTGDHYSLRHRCTPTSSRSAYPRTTTVPT